MTEPIEPSQPKVSKKSRRVKWIVTGVVLLLIMLLVAIIVGTKARNQRDQSSATPTPTATLEQIGGTVKCLNNKPAVGVYIEVEGDEQKPPFVITSHQTPSKNSPTTISYSYGIPAGKSYKLSAGCGWKDSVNKVWNDQLSTEWVRGTGHIFNCGKPEGKCVRAK